MSSRRILIVDDDKAVLDLLKLSIQLLWPEYQVVTAGDGLGALAELNRQSFRLILTDFEMPCLSGLDLIYAVRQFCPEIPIIMMTGSRSDEVKAKVVSTNLAGFLSKPFAIVQLKELLQQNGI